MKKSGTFMYHPHADEMVQMAMGMMGFLVVHPRDPKFMRVDRDFVFLLNAYDIDPGQLHPAREHHARLQPVVVELARIPGHRSVRCAQRRSRAHPLRQPHHDQPPDPHARLRFRGDVHRRRLGAEVGALARGHRGRGGGPDACLRVRRGCAGRLGDPLPQVASRDERHGPQRADDDRRGPPRRGGEDHEARARLHGDGRARHGRHGRDGNAASRQHAADDDGRRARSGRSRWAACSRWSRCAKDWRGTTTRIRAGTSIRRGRCRTRGRAKPRARSGSPRHRARKSRSKYASPAVTVDTIRESR
jgi:hypothetical protein